MVYPYVLVYTEIVNTGDDFFIRVNVLAVTFANGSDRVDQEILHVLHWVHNKIVSKNLLNVLSNSSI